MASSESDRLAGEGVVIVLAGGRKARLRYSMRSLKAFEDDFGSVEGALVALNGLRPTIDNDQLVAPVNTRTVSTVVPALAAGLIDEGITADDLLDGLAIYDQVPDYLDAIADAIDQAFPPPPASSGKAPRKGSRGGPSTTRSRSDSGEATPPSGP